MMNTKEQNPRSSIESKLYNNTRGRQLPHQFIVMAKATEEDIKRWLGKAASNGYTHILVVCDTFDYSTYTVYCTGKLDYVSKCKHYRQQDMQRVDETIEITIKRFK